MCMSACVHMHTHASTSAQSHIHLHTRMYSHIAYTHPLCPEPLTKYKALGASQHCRGCLQAFSRCFLGISASHLHPIADAPTTFSCLFRKMLPSPGAMGHVPGCPEWGAAIVGFLSSLQALDGWHLIKRYFPSIFCGCLHGHPCPRLPRENLGTPLLSPLTSGLQTPDEKPPFCTQL